MRIVARIVAALFLAIAVFLVVAVVNALLSEGGAKPGVAVLYILISIALAYIAFVLWRRTLVPRAEAMGPGAPPPPPVGPGGARPLAEERGGARPADAPGGAPGPDVER